MVSAELDALMQDLRALGESGDAGPYKRRGVRKQNGAVYYPSREQMTFRRLLDEGGPPALLDWLKRHLREMTPPSSGWNALVEADAVDLSWEAQVLKHRSLFTERELAIAQRRVDGQGSAAARRRGGRAAERTQAEEAARRPRPALTPEKRAELRTGAFAELDAALRQRRA